MMAEQYSIPCFNSLIIVKESEDLGFDLFMKDASNPLSNGTLLSTYTTEEKAIRKADHFCSMYGLAREKGYHLKGNVLVKPDCEDIPVNLLLKADVTQEQLLSILGGES
jgi:hypothetical protein